MIDLMTAGVATSKKDIYRKFTRYQYPSNIMTLVRTKEDRGIAKEVLNKMGQQLHWSIRKTREEFLSFFKIMISNPKFKKKIIEPWFRKRRIKISYKIIDLFLGLTNCFYDTQTIFFIFHNFITPFILYPSFCG